MQIDKAIDRVNLSLRKSVYKASSTRHRSLTIRAADNAVLNVAEKPYA
ncbi:unknown protein [Cronobacter turicensis z3032]|uniref:Uncharacterized protein n=1 Tax=Cronobacter turicensis (strain DSM 18703 / CCUG 55852 / LMG 23827 / z3032) TaxID=693216 RepID=C9XZQ3_CROTZ|nr:unknown protein [Cronobacter turicensis z3032]